MLVFLNLFFAVLLTSASFARAEEVTVYYSASVTQVPDSVFLRQAFSGKRLAWENGDSIVLMLQNLKGVDEGVFAKFAQQTKNQFLDSWRIKFFSGRALVPIQATSPDAAITTIKQNPAAIYFKFTPTDAVQDEAIKTVRIPL